MKRAAAVILCFVFLFNCAGWQYVFLSMQVKVHEKNWSNSSITSSEPENYFVIKEDGKVLHLNTHELMHSGKLFDIISIEKMADGIKYICRQDAKEDALIASFLKTNSNSKDENTTLKTVIIKGSVEYVATFNHLTTGDETLSLRHVNIVFALSAKSSPPPFSPPEA